MTYTRSIASGTPTPAVVLTLGQMGTQIAGEMEAIFLRGDSRRAAVTTFLTLGADERGAARLVPLQAGDLEQDGQMSRREAGERIISHGARLRADLEWATREMRTHERLNQAGLGDVLAPPLDIVLLADLTEPAASGMFIPLAAICGEMVRTERDCSGHLILNAATFGGANDEADAGAGVYAALKELEALLRLKAQAPRDRLAQALELEYAASWEFRVYLFDHRKEGTREVKDRAELHIIVGNFLLSLLSGGLAGQIARNLPAAEMHEGHAYNSSAAATALIFEPDPLIEACAGRMGAEFIIAELGQEAAPDPRLPDELAGELVQHLGGARDWVERLCADTPCELRETNGDLELGLHFSGFRFERIDKEAWGEAIATYDSMFRHVKVPRYEECIAENADSLAEECLTSQKTSIDSLPETPWLYPDGIENSRKTLQRLDERLADRADWLARRRRRSVRNADADLDALERAAWNFPDLPAFLARMLILCVVAAYALIGLGNGLAQDHPPASLLGWIGAAAACTVIVAAMAFWLHRKDRRLIALRQQCIRNSEEEHAAALENAAREHLLGLSVALREQIAQGLTDLAALERAVGEARDSLAARWTSASAGWRSAGSNGQVFRPMPVDPNVADWIYVHWRQTPEGMRLPVLETHRWLVGWRDVSAQELAARLLKYGTDMFGPIQDLSLEEILVQRDGPGLEPLLLDLAREAVPLLRHDFDRLGGGGHIITGRSALLADPGRSGLAELVKRRLPDWSVLATGDRCVAACCQVRHMIPLRALPDLVRQTRRAYEGLGPTEKMNWHLFDEWAALPEIELA